MRKLEHKTSSNGRAALLENEGGTLKIGGYLTVWNVRDAGGDRTVRGSFAKAIKANAGGTLPLLYGHEMGSLPLGTASIIREDEHGVLFSGIVANTRAGKDIRALLEQTGGLGVSYSYNCKSKQVALPGGGYGRDLVEVFPVAEVSLTAFPMLDVARVTTWAAKGAVADRVLIAEVDKRRADNEPLTAREMLRYAEAQDRELGRVLFNGRTEAEHTSHFLRLLRQELAEVQKL